MFQIIYIYCFTFQSMMNASQTNIPVMKTLCVSTLWEDITVSASQVILGMALCAKVSNAGEQKSNSILNSDN